MNCEYCIIGGSIKASTTQKIISNGYLINPNENIDNYKLDKDLSGQRVQVYHDENNNNVIINHRGTKGLNDMYTDLKLSLGYDKNKIKRFQHSNDVVNKANEKYKNSKIIQLGHSLGYQLAKNSNSNDDEIIGVNPAILPSDIIKNQKDNEYIIRSKNDIISGLHTINPFQKKENTINIDSKSINPITEHKSTILSRLNDDFEIGKNNYNI